MLDRRLTRLLHEPPTVRVAASAIVSGTAIVVIGAGVLIRFVDHDEYDNVWVGVWWALQTATTVGYGDVTPAHLSGRLVAAFVMLQGIAFLAILTAAITSVFVARASEDLRAQHRLEAGEAAEAGPLAHFDTRFDELERKLARLEAALGSPPDA
jgi:voltage-gated potassium channel